MLSLPAPDPPNLPASTDARPPALAAPPDLIGEWLAARKETTRRAYAGDVTHFAAFLAGDGAEAGPVLDGFLLLGAGDAHRAALAYRNAMLARNLASATIARRLAALRSVVKLARQTGRVVWALQVQAPPAEPRRDVTGPDASERRKLWRFLKADDSPRGRRDRALFALLFGLGLRRSEVTELDLAHVDFRGRSVSILGKGKRERRALALPAEVVAALEGWVFVRGREPGPLFTRTDRPGGRLSGEGLALAVKRAGEGAGLSKRLRPHGMRHAAITSALNGGASVREARDFSRHASIETLIRYDDERNQAQPRVAASVAKELRGGAGRPKGED